MNLLFIRSSKALPFLLLLAYWPIGCLLFIQSWAWPRNWDDMHRAFNGIDPYHNFVELEKVALGRGFISAPRAPVRELHSVPRQTRA